MYGICRTGLIRLKIIVDLSGCIRSGGESNECGREQILKGEEGKGI